MAADVPAIFAATPTNRLLGARLVHRTPARVELEAPVRAEFLQEENVVHGGILTMLADTAAVYLVWPELQPDRTMTSIDFTMSFLAPGVPGKGPLCATAVPVRVGRSIAVCESTVSQDGTLLAKGVFHYLIRARRP